MAIRHGDLEWWESPRVQENQIYREPYLYTFTVEWDIAPHGQFLIEVMLPFTAIRRLFQRERKWQIRVIRADLSRKGWRRAQEVHSELLAEGAEGADAVARVEELKSAAMAGERIGFEPWFDKDV